MVGAEEESKGANVPGSYGPSCTMFLEAYGRVSAGGGEAVVGWWEGEGRRDGMVWNGEGGGEIPPKVPQSMTYYGWTMYFLRCV